MTPKNIIFNLPTGSHYRNLLQSAVLDELLKLGDFKFIMVTPAYDLPEFQAEFERFDKARVHFYPAVLFEDNIKEKISRFMLNRFFLTKNYDLPAKVWHGFSTFLFKPVYYDALFEKFPPALVVLPSPGIIYHDLPMLRATAAKNIPTLSVINSWDNLVTKWPRFGKCDKIAVWNTMMRDDAIRRHHYTKDEIDVVGIAHYDYYFKEDTYFKRDAFFERLGLDKNKKVVCLTTAPAKSLSDHTFILKELIDFQEAGKFGESQILCRFHPSEDGSEYDVFKGTDDVIFDHPGRCVKEPFGFFPTMDDVRRLASTLKYSDVVINMASTTTIESGIVGTPVVNLGFSLSQPEEFEYHIVKNHWGKHYKHILECHAVQIARSKQDLCDCVKKALDDPSLNKENALKMAEKLTHSLDANSSKRVANSIFKAMSNYTGSQK